MHVKRVKSWVNQWEESSETSEVEDTHLVHMHSDVPPCPHMPAFRVTDSARSASSSGWGVSLSDLNSPKGRKLCTTIPKTARWLLNLHTGLHPATWKSVTGSHSFEGQWGRGKGELVLSADEQETFLSIAAKPALLISIQSWTEMP